MTRNNLKIWVNVPFAVSQETAKKMLFENLENYEWRLFESAENGSSGESEQFLLDADIAFGQPDVDRILESERLRWAQISSAGYANYDRDDLRQRFEQRGAILTNSSAVFDQACAEHLLAMIMSLTRNLPLALNNQRTTRAWQPLKIRERTVLLGEQTLVILGFGEIARRLIELLQPFKMKIIGVRRRPRGDEACQIVPETEVDRVLSIADHVVNILPDNPGTRDFLSAARLSNLKSGAKIYNIGRGTTIDQNVLIKNLESGQIGAAYLDVTEPEPLPAEHPLWSTPNCYITPHTAGGSRHEKVRYVQHFLDNLRRFETGESLRNRIF